MIETSPAFVCGVVVKHVAHVEEIATNCDIPELVMHKSPAASDILCSAVTCETPHRRVLSCTCSTPRSDREVALTSWALVLVVKRLQLVRVIYSGEEWVWHHASVCIDDLATSGH